jgi:hypothetical protein
MRTSIKLAFAFSTLLSFAMAVLVLHHTYSAESKFQEIPYDAFIEKVRTTDDMESIKRLLIAQLKSERALTRSEIRIFNYMACAILSFGLLNIGIFLLLLEKSNRAGK